MKPVNDVFYGKVYRVVLSEFNSVLVDAPSADAALDEAIDYAESQDWVGLFLDQDEIQELESEGFLDDHICGGNHGLYLSSLNAGHVTFKGYIPVADYV